MDQNREISTPVHTLDTSQVRATLLSATVLGGLIGGSLCAVASGIGVPMPWEAVPAVVLPAVAACYWWQIKPKNRVTWQVEKLLGRDLDGDRHIGKPPLILEVHTDKGVKRIELGDDNEHLRTFAVTALDNGLNERDMCRMMAWTREEWVAARDRMLKRGFAEWKGRHQKQGVRLTVDGMAAMEAAVREIEGGG